MSLIGDMIVAGIKGIKFNPKFYKVNYIYRKMHHQDFLSYTKIVLVR